MTSDVIEHGALATLSTGSGPVGQTNAARARWRYRSIAMGSSVCVCQRTQVRMIPSGKWTPLPLTAVVTPSQCRVHHRETSYLKSAANGNATRLFQVI
jgi:hypothetical protein